MKPYWVYPKGYEWVILECLDCTPKHYDTWEDYWRAEHEIMDV